MPQIKSDVVGINCTDDVSEEIRTQAVDAILVRNTDWFYYETINAENNQEAA